MVTRGFTHDEYYGAADRAYDPWYEDTINEFYSDGVPLPIGGGGKSERLDGMRPPRCSVALEDKTTPMRKVQR